MPERLPIQAAKNLARDYDCRQVIVAAWDGARTHVVTYGESIEDCDQAALGGDKIKAALGWPEELNAVPSRVKKLQEQVAALQAEIADLNKQLATSTTSTVAPWTKEPEYKVYVVQVEEMRDTRTIQGFKVFQTEVMARNFVRACFVEDGNEKPLFTHAAYLGEITVSENTYKSVRHADLYGYYCKKLDALPEPKR